MIHGIGTDIVQIERIAKIYERHGERLVRHILMDVEAEAFRSQPRAARFLAMRFAAKEAIVKAMGCSISATGRSTIRGQKMHRSSCISCFHISHRNDLAGIR